MRRHNSLYTIDSDYLDSPETKELNGVYYPDWGAEAFNLAFELGADRLRH